MKKTFVTKLVFSFIALAMPVSANDKMMTWTSQDLSTNNGPWANHPIENATFLSCHGDGQSCDTYRGDMPDTSDLRIACVIPGNNPEPAAYAKVRETQWSDREESSSVKTWRYFMGWTKNELGLTRRVSELKADGIISNIPIASRAEGDAACRAEMQSNFARMLEFHESGGGWGVAGRIHESSKAVELLTYEAGKERFIVRINDEPSNPWN